MLGTVITGFTIQGMVLNFHQTMLAVHVCQQTHHCNQSKEENSVVWPLVLIMATMLKKLIHYHSSQCSRLHLTWAANGIIYTGGAISHREAVTLALQ